MSSTKHLGVIAQTSTNPPTQAEQTSLAKINQRRFHLLNLAREIRPQERLRHCCKTPRARTAQVVGYYQYDHASGKKSARIDGLQHCGSSSCPVCAYRRAKHDQQNLRVALSQAEKLSLHPLMVTLTLSHNVTNNLKPLHDALNDAYQATFSTGGWWSRFAAEFGICAKVTSWEVMIGEHGFHPHLHVLLFLDTELRGDHLIDFQEPLRGKWHKQIVKRGFDADYEHGLDVLIANSKIASYIAKWGRDPIDSSRDCASEALPSIRQQRGGLTMFQLLAASDSTSDDCAAFAEMLRIADHKVAAKLAARMWGEYFDVFKGKPRLFWSQKARAALDLDNALEQYDRANPAPQKESVKMVAISAHGSHGWQRIHHYPTVDNIAGECAFVDLRADFWSLVRMGDAFALADWLRDKEIDAEILAPDYWHNIPRLMWFGALSREHQPASITLAAMDSWSTPRVTYSN